MAGKAFRGISRFVLGLVFFADGNPRVRECQIDMVTESSVRPANASIYHVSVDDIKSFVSL